jgi:hypothetical protein
MVESWDSEVGPADLGIGVVLRRGGEVLDQGDNGSLCVVLDKSRDPYLSEGPVHLHGPEGEHVDVVHQRVGVRHLCSL